METASDVDYFSQQRGSVSRYADPSAGEVARQAAVSPSSSSSHSVTATRRALESSNNNSNNDTNARPATTADASTTNAPWQPSTADFDSSFLAIAAAARAQAEASASSGGVVLMPEGNAAPSSTLAPTSSDMPVNPPLPHTDAVAPFPIPLTDRHTATMQGQQAALVDREVRSDSSRTKRSKIMEVGEEELAKTRCYWAILSTKSALSSSSSSAAPSPTFVFLDPIFAKHIGTGAETMLGTSFFDYIHPEEKARAEQDMRNIVDSKTLFGSVSRCRYSRVPRIRKILASSSKEPPTPKSLQAPPAEFIPIDIVVNWIGADMALCFFHAILDKSPQDNNEVQKTEWSNWCGLPADTFTAQDSQQLWSDIRGIRKLEPSATGPAYVFQILSADSLPDVLFSWPPPRIYSRIVREKNGRVMQQQQQQSQRSYADGSYFAEDFAKLAQGVDSLKRELSDANTSCTRRFRAKHTLTTDALLRSVESVLIPYGSIVLACFGITYAQPVGGSELIAVLGDPQASRRRQAQQEAAVTAQTMAAGQNQPLGEADEALPNKRRKIAAPASSFSPDTATRAAELVVANSVDGEGGASNDNVATLAAVAAAAAAQTKQCESCGTSQSPEWRKGPDGTKSMCNACGLRYARSIARARKREERARIAAEVAANGGIIPPHLRKQPGQQQQQQREREEQRKQRRKQKEQQRQREAEAKEEADRRDQAQSTLTTQTPLQGLREDTGQGTNNLDSAHASYPNGETNSGSLDVTRTAVQAAAAAASATAADLS